MMAGIADEILDVETDAGGKQLQVQNDPDNLTIERENQSVETIIVHDNVLRGDDDLPAGWKKINHDSGVPVYYDEESKVCSFGKPYFIGPNSFKNHEIPKASIPCLSYKSKLEENTARKQDNENECSATLTHEEYREYCKKLFKFKTVKYTKFPSWDIRRKHSQKLKCDQLHENLPKLIQKSKVLLLPSQLPGNVNGKTPNNSSDPESLDTQWILSLVNKNYVSILYNYVQKMFKTKIIFEFKNLDNSIYPYSATVVIDGMKYGTGIGNCKKLAKLNAAQIAFDVLVPSSLYDVKIHHQLKMNDQQNHVLPKTCSIFDGLKIQDSTIPELCAQVGEYTPYEMLQICAKRNFNEIVNIYCAAVQNNPDSKFHLFYTVSIKKHTSTVICETKREGQQKASQKLLKKLHPHVSFFGSLLRLYSHQVNTNCSYMEKTINKTKETQKPRKKVNHNLMSQLREAMSKIQDETILV